MDNTAAKSRLRIAGSITLSPVVAVLALATLVASGALVLFGVLTL